MRGWCPREREGARVCERELGCVSDERKYTCVIVMRDELVREWGLGRDGRERLTRDENGEREKERLIT